MMIDPSITALATELLSLTLALSLPVISVTAGVGMLFSLIQALTQVQDQTMQFLIKLLAASVTLMMTYHWMGDAIFVYINTVFSNISTIGSDG